MTTMLRMHERTSLVDAAERDLERVVLDWQMKHDLSYLEILQSMTIIQGRTLKYALRHERHPDPECEYKGDEQCSNPECRESRE